MATVFILIALYIVYAKCDDFTCYPYPDVCMNASELVTSKGYPFKSYDVITDDGYILGLQRIAHGRYNKYSDVGKRPVVFLQHGLLCSSTNWITNMANQSFAYILADAGFDVFLGNNRGNTYSRRHIKYKDTDAEFWDFTWDEMARYDLPSMVDTALRLSGQKSLHYVGHSQGTVTMFAAASQNATFSNLIKEVYALAPIYKLGGLIGPLKYLSYFTWELQDLLEIFGIREFLPDSEIIKFLGKTVCDFESRVFCEDILFIICGFDKAQLNETRLPVYFNNVPAGTSTKDIVHFAQMVRNDKFQKYDYGSSRLNFKHYGQAHPPQYNISNMNVSMVLFYGDHDWLADPSDVNKLVKVVPNLKHLFEIKKWDHLDFVWGIDAAELIYRPIIKLIRESL